MNDYPQTGEKPGFFRQFLYIKYHPLIPICSITFFSLFRGYEEFSMMTGGMYLQSVLFGLMMQITFYTLAFFLFSLALSRLLQIGWERAAGAVSVGLIFSVLPPILDLFIGLPKNYYIYLTEFSWWFISPEQPWGETISIWLVIIGGGIFVAGLTRSPVRGVCTLVVFWLILQLLLWGLADLVGLGSFCLVKNLPFVELFFILLSMLIYAMVSWKRVRPSLQRFGHALPWGLFAAAGATVEGYPTVHIIFVGVLMAVLFQIVIFHNDWFDREDDARGGRAVGISRDDAVMWGFFAVLLVAWMGTVMAYHLGLLAGFFLIWTAYHLPPLRFKRRFCLNYLVEGFAGMIAFMAGGFGPKTVPHAPGFLWFSLLVGGGSALISMLKDWKDVESDRAAGINTVYVFFSRRGHDEKSIHRTVVFLSFVAMLIPAVYFWAGKGMIAGALALGIAAAGAAAVILRMPERQKATRFWLGLLSFYLVVIIFSASAGIQRSFCYTRSMYLEYDPGEVVRMEILKRYQND